VPDAFDPEAYKRTIFEQWETGASAWHKWRPTIENWLAEATEIMLDLVHVSAGSHVLDVAAGTGGQTLAAARRLGPTGSVLATDISPRSLLFTAAEAEHAELWNVATRTMDGERLDVEAGAYDAVISRIGLTYFPDEQAALSGIMRALKPGGRLAAVVYSTAERNPCFATPISIIRRRMKLPPPAPGQPGPFSLGRPELLEHAYVCSGFGEITVMVVNATLHMSSAAECVRFEREALIGLTQMMAGLDDQEQEKVWGEIRHALVAFEDGDGFAGPSQLLVAAGTKPS
jgi:SAM-dependent methyltransferase